MVVCCTQLILLRFRNPNLHCMYMWIFFGWGTKNRLWDIGNSQRLIAVWRYAHVFWLPIISSEITWHIVSDVRSEDKQITYQEARHLAGDKEISIGMWERFGLLYTVGYVVSSYWIISILPITAYVLIPFPVCFIAYALLGGEIKWIKRLVLLWIVLTIALGGYYLSTESASVFLENITSGIPFLTGVVAFLTTLIWRTAVTKVPPPTL